MREHAKTFFSTRAWGRRLKRVVTCVCGYWVGMSSITPETGWDAFGSAISTPYAILGLVLVVAGAWHSSGHEPRSGQSVPG